jgi:aspartate/methionine/tyrosine aminotransferase
VHIDQITENSLATELAELESQYAALKAKGLALDLTRGKPGAEQLTLSDALDGILKGNYQTSGGIDTRNYAGLEGLPEARALFGEILGAPAEETLVGGNASLSLMYTTIDFALTVGLRGPESAWGNSDVVKFLCPAPGYDRHFAVCEHLGIEMITVPMLDTGPDMDFAENAVKEDDSIRGIWCVPRFSNPTGCVYSDETVERIAGLGKLAAEHFVVMWDNAYAVHTLNDAAPKLASIREACLRQGTLDNVFQFGSTSKITFAGAGVCYMSSSRENLDALVQHLGYSTIGPDKVNQLRHVRFFGPAEESVGNIGKHMAAHADIIRPRFEAVLNTLENELGGTGMGSWLTPQGGYFISFDTLPGLAKEVVQLANDIGVKLTPAGATYPYGKDPDDSNIRLAPTFPALEDVVATAQAFVICVKLATLRQKAARS